MLVLPIVLFAIPISFIPIAEGAVSSVNSDNSGRFLGQAGSDGGACSTMAASGGGFHPNNGGTSQAGRSDGNRCYVGWWRIDLSGLPAGDAISAMTFTFPAISASGGYSADIELRFMTTFSVGSNACSNSNNDGDTALYDDIIDSSNSTAVSTGDPTSIWSSSTIAISSAGVTIAQNQRSSATAAEDVDSLCIVAYESGGPKGGPSSGTEPVYNWASNPGIVASITHAPSLSTITVQLYDSSNSTLLNFREPAVRMEGINGTSSAWVECPGGTCTFTGISPATPIRVFANFSDNVVKISGENSYNRTCAADCDLKLPVSVYASTNLYFYNATGGLSVGDIVSFDVQYANSTTQTITINGPSSTVLWLPNGTNSVLSTNLVSNHGLTLNSTTSFNSTANGQGFSFLLDYKTIIYTLNLKANDLTTAVDFASQQPTVRAVSLNGSVSSYQTCAATCNFKVFANEPIGFQTRWSNQGVLTNSSNMINATSANDKTLIFQLSIYKNPKLIEYTNNYTLFSPNELTVILGNTSTVTISDFVGGIRSIGWLANGTNTIVDTDILGGNRNANDTVTFSATSDDQAFSFRNRIYGISFIYESADHTLSIIPTSHTFTLSNTSTISLTDRFTSFWLGNTTLTTTGLEYQNSNMCQCNGSISISDNIHALFNLQYYKTNYLARNYVNTTIPADTITYKMTLVNNSNIESITDASGDFIFYSGNGTITNFNAWWKSLIVNGTLNDRQITTNQTFYVITQVVEDPAGIGRWAVNNSAIQGVESLGTKLKWWSNNTQSQVLKLEILPLNYNQPTNLVLNSTTYNRPALSWNWDSTNRILSASIPFTSGFNSSIIVPYDPSITNSSILHGLRPGVINLLAGNIIQAVAAPYVSIMGLWFYVFIVGTVGLLGYLKSSSVWSALVGIMITTLGFVSISSRLLLPPVAIYFAAILVILGLTIVFYRLFKRDD
tara:strand:+ start:11130 stop:13994 length:2865 start_codon:yes stop_codon:yes gene_type:complete